MRKLVLSVLPVVVLVFSAGAVTGCKSKWVKRIEEIEKAACACKDSKCALEQQKALNAFSKDAQGVKVRKSDKKKVENLGRKASLCILNAIRKDSRKRLEKK
jgi:hypothetical protein